MKEFNPYVCVVNGRQIRTIDQYGVDLASIWETMKSPPIERLRKAEIGDRGETTETTDRNWDSLRTLLAIKRVRDETGLR